jgi:hypothetical protein
MVNRKSHFEGCSDYRRLNKHKIRQKLTEFNEYLSTLGLALCSKENISIKLLNEHQDLENIRFKISNEYETDHDSNADNSESRDSILNTLFVADSVYLSSRTYQTIRKGMNLKDRLPAYCQLNFLKKKIQLFFQTAMTVNRNGCFLKNPLHKVEFVLKKILLNLTIMSEQVIIKDNTFIIKISGDGKVLTKSSSREINNIVFTIVNEVKKCKTSIGNYILGKLI